MGIMLVVIAIILVGFLYRWKADATLPSSGGTGSAANTAAKGTEVISPPSKHVVAIQQNQPGIKAAVSTSRPMVAEEGEVIFREFLSSLPPSAQQGLHLDG